MENLKIKGIVVGSLDYKETSKIVYLYTKLGKISVKALGAKAKKSKTLSFTSTLNLVDAIITNSNFPTLIDYSLISQNSFIKENLKTNLFINFIFEIVNKLPTDINHERTYDFLVRILEHANKGVDPLLLTILFQFKILSVFGVAPLLKKCVKCGNDKIISFSIKDGGALCNNCNHSHTFNHDILKQLIELYYFDDKTANFDIFKDYDLIKLFNLVNLYYDNHVHMYLKGLNTLIF